MSGAVNWGELLTTLAGSVAYQVQQGQWHSNSNSVISDSCTASTPVVIQVEVHIDSPRSVGFALLFAFWLGCTLGSQSASGTRLFLRKVANWLLRVSGAPAPTRERPSKGAGKAPFFE